MSKAKAKPEWATLKSGVRRNGDWFIAQYPKGFYLYGGKPYKSFGLFDSFTEAVKKHANT